MTDSSRSNELKNAPYSQAFSEVDSDALTRLALDLNWSWSRSGDEIRKCFAAEFWELTEKPRSATASQEQVWEGFNHA